MSSYLVYDDVEALFTMIRVEVEIHLDTGIMRWEEDIDGITGSLPGSLPRLQRCLGVMIHTDQETTMVPL